MQHIIAKTIALTFMLSSLAFSQNIHHIFIHGTSLIEPSPLIKSQSFLSKIGIRKETIVNFLKNERAKPKHEAREILLSPGLIEITPSCISDYLTCKRTYAYEKKAAYPTIAFFSQFIEQTPSTKHRFYTFGWSGTLNHEARIEASAHLYRSLNDLVKQDKNNSPEICLYAHSHGGTVALLLAEQAKSFKGTFTIDRLILYGTPLQPETANLARSPLFKNEVFNIYSRGDWIQPFDIFSGTTWRPKRRLGDYLDTASLNRENPHKFICDIQLLINNDPKAVGHHNMWLYNKIGTNLPCLAPLPLVALTPCIIEIAQQQSKNSIAINITSSSNSVTIHDTEHKNCIKAFIKAPK